MDSYTLSLLLTVFIILFAYSRIFHFCIKVLVHYIVMYLSCTLAIPIAMFWPKNVKNINVGSFFALHLSRIFSYHFETRGLEHLSSDVPGVVVCNHQSSIDVICMMKVWPTMPKCASVIKKELMFAGSFGILAWLCDSVSIDRSNSTRAQKSLDHALKHLTEKKTKLWIFPEGTRNASGTLLPFKKGAFHLAIESQCPIFPVTISSQASFYDTKLYKFNNGGKIIITALPPVSTKGLTKGDINSLIERVRSEMQKSITKTTKEVMCPKETH